MSTFAKLRRSDARAADAEQLVLLESVARLLEKVVLNYHGSLDTKYVSRLKNAIALIRGDREFRDPSRHAKKPKPPNPPPQS